MSHGREIWRSGSTAAPTSSFKLFDSPDAVLDAEFVCPGDTSSTPINEGQSAAKLRGASLRAWEFSSCGCDESRPQGQISAARPVRLAGGSHFLAATPACADRPDRQS